MINNVWTINAKYVYDIRNNEHTNLIFIISYLFKMSLNEKYFFFYMEKNIKKIGTDIIIF